MKKNYPALDMNVLKSKKRINVSTEEALKNITPIEWGSNVENNKVKVYVTTMEEESECVK